MVEEVSVVVEGEDSEVVGEVDSEEGEAEADFSMIRVLLNL